MRKSNFQSVWNCISSPSVCLCCVNDIPHHMLHWGITSIGIFMAKTSSLGFLCLYHQLHTMKVQSCKVYLTVWSQSNLLVWDLNAAPCSPSSPLEQEGCALKQESEPFARRGSKPNSTWRIAVAGFAYFVIAMHWGYWRNCLRMLEHLRMAQHLYFNNPIGAHAANYHPNAFPSFWVESLPKKRLSW